MKSHKTDNTLQIKVLQSTLAQQKIARKGHFAQYVIYVAQYWIRPEMLTD